MYHKDSHFTHTLRYWNIAVWVVALGSLVKYVASFLAGLGLSGAGGRT